MQDFALKIKHKVIRINLRTSVERWQFDVKMLKNELTSHFALLMDPENIRKYYPLLSLQRVVHWILRPIFAQHCIVLYPPNNKLTIQYNGERNITIECDTRPCINLSEYWTILVSPNLKFLLHQVTDLVYGWIYRQNAILPCPFRRYIRLVSFATESFLV